jgi:hypothetical protein
VGELHKKHQRHKVLRVPKQKHRLPEEEYSRKVVIADPVVEGRKLRVGQVGPQEKVEKMHSSRAKEKKAKKIRR